MTRSPFDELVHRINNLLGTIEMQFEVARSANTLAAHADALRLIVESARRTNDEVRRLREAKEDLEPESGQPPPSRA